MGGGLVESLAAAYLEELEQRGFCVLPGVVPADRLERVAAAYDRAFAEGTEPDLHRGRSGDNVRLADLVNRGAEFDELYLLEPVLAACQRVIGPNFKLSSFSGRTVLPGAREQSLHVDVRRADTAWPLVGFIVMVDEFRAGNGATRFVPGTHLEARDDSAYEGNTRPERAVELACGPPGSVIVYHGSTWHGYSRNDSAAPRRSAQGAYIPPAGTALDWRRRMQPATLERLSPLAKELLSLG